jgi:hypothetical protein
MEDPFHSLYGEDVGWDGMAPLTAKSNAGIVRDKYLHKTGSVTHIKGSRWRGFALGISGF